MWGWGGSFKIGTWVGGRGTTFNSSPKVSTSSCREWRFWQSSEEKTVRITFVGGRLDQKKGTSENISEKGSAWSDGGLQGSKRQPVKRGVRSAMLSPRVTNTFCPPRSWEICSDCPYVFQWEVGLFPMWREKLQEGKEGQLPIRQEYPGYQEKAHKLGWVMGEAFWFNLQSYGQAWMSFKPPGSCVFYGGSHTYPSYLMAWCKDPMREWMWTVIN